MKNSGSRRASPRRAGYFWLAAGPVIVGVVAIVIAIQPAAAADSTVGLGTADSFAVLAGSTVTNTGLSVISGDLGVSPGSAVTGFPPGLVNNGSIHAADAVAAGAQTDLTTAYNVAAERAVTASFSSIGSGQTLGPGVYNAPSSLAVGGSLTLDAGGDPNAVFIFQAGSTLITDTGTTIVLANGAQACNVFWQVGSSATIATSNTFAGTVLALTSITVETGDTIMGRVLAQNGAVTLDDDAITVPACSMSASPSPSPTGSRPTPSPTATPSPSVTASPSPSVTASPSPSETVSPSPSPTGRPTPSPTATPSPSVTASPSPSDCPS